MLFREYGYGDIYPVTVIGKLIGICIAFLGVGVVAIPTGIISAGFVEQYTKNQQSDVRFPDIKEVGEILIDRKSGFSGMSVLDIREKYSLSIHVILRGELTIVPVDSVKLKMNDILIVKSEKIDKSKK